MPNLLQHVPQNLDNVPYTEMQFKDAVLEREFLLFHDSVESHEENLYGDMNALDGQSVRVFTVEPRWQRFAWVNSSPARPYKLLIVDEAGTAISGSICRVIAGDGGFRREPAAYPAAGIFIAVAERWEVGWGCDRRRGLELLLQGHALPLFGLGEYRPCPVCCRAAARPGCLPCIDPLPAPSLPRRHACRLCATSPPWPAAA